MSVLLYVSGILYFHVVKPLMASIDIIANKIMFLQVSVCPHGGACVVFSGKGVHGFFGEGGACVVFFGGVCSFFGGRAWFLGGGVCGFFR